VPLAKLTAKHLETARQYTTITNEVGFYDFPAVLSGRYELAVEAAGLEKFKGEFLLQTGQTAVVDASLRVGSSATEVTVSVDAMPLVTTTSGTLANVTDRARIDQLPISGRMFQSLVVQTTPGLSDILPPARTFGASSDTVWIQMKDGTLQRTTLNTNLNPWRNQYLSGLFNWGLNTSLFKVIPVNERVFFRLNIDFFNVLNMPGIPKTPDPDSGIIDASFSGNGARALQFALRLTW